MGNIKIIRGVFDTKLELEHANVVAGFPNPADDYRNETLDFNRDYIKHPEASFYGDVSGDSMRDAGIFDGDRGGVNVVVYAYRLRLCLIVEHHMVACLSPAAAQERAPLR